jgi:hypothetical protein
MKMKKTLFLLLLILVLLVAGCIRQAPTPTGIATGVIIEKFAPERSEVFSGDEVVIRLNVKNVGEEDAENVRARLFGLGTDWGGERTASKSAPDILQKSQPNIPGGTWEEYWNVVAPKDLKVDTSYSIGVRVLYKYKTTAYGTIKVYNDAYLKTKPEEAEKILKTSGIESFTVTKAPVTVSLIGVVRPLIFKNVGQNASVTIQVEDVGPGDPYLTNEGDMNINIKVEAPYNQTCIPLQAQRLPRTGPKSIPCKFTFKENITDYTTIPIKIELSYNYFLDGSSSIKVLRAIS